MIFITEGQLYLFLSQSQGVNLQILHKTPNNILFILTNSNSCYSFTAIKRDNRFEIAEKRLNYNTAVTVEIPISLW